MMSFDIIFNPWLYKFNILQMLNDKIFLNFRDLDYKVQILIIKTVSMYV